jgi:hypothetical protein
MELVCPKRVTTIVMPLYSCLLAIIDVRGGKPLCRSVPVFMTSCWMNEYTIGWLSHIVYKLAHSLAIVDLCLFEST